jgi:hypothetical protein
VAGLIGHFGAEKVVGIVHTVAFANFHGRLLLALKVEVEPAGPLPPLDLRFGRGMGARAPARRAWPAGRKGAHPAGAPAGWGEKTVADLGRALARQKGRKSRIPLPGPGRVAKIPAEAKAQASRVVWTHVSMGYQPALTKGWFDCMGAFREEAGLDRVFANTMFWVITRSNECFY